MIEAEGNVRSLRGELQQLSQRQDSIHGRVDLIYETSTEFFSTLEERINTQRQLTSQLWIGLARVGGWIPNTARPLDVEEQRYLTHINNENMMEQRVSEVDRIDIHTAQEIPKL